MHLKTGTSLKFGSYVIESVLGQGGFGITYMAVQTALDRKVAIKEFFMKEHCERDESTSSVSLGTSGSREMVLRFKNKFIREAQTIAKMNHPHIVRIYDVFEENGTAYYVMEYHASGSLADMDLPMPTDKALGYVRQIGSALDYLHSRNVMHLDVKPSNVLVDDASNAVLIDFGVSKRYDESGHQTSSTPVGISHGYAPIEQYSQSSLTFSPATDIYALGATLYKLLTGQTPPEASVVNDEGLPKFPKYVPTPLRAVIEKAMQSRRKDRPQSVAEFLALLDAAAEEERNEEDESEEDEIVVQDDQDETDVVVSDHGQTGEQSSDSTSDSASDCPSGPASRKHHLWLWLLLLAFMIGVVATVVFTGKNDDAKKSDAEQTAAPVPLVDQVGSSDIKAARLAAEQAAAQKKAEEEAKKAEEAKKMAAAKSLGGSANCYIVSSVGSYKFPTVQGNSNTPVGSVASAEVLWESFGTAVEPNVGDLIKSVSYSDDYITFKTADNFKEGNAVIAAKDASGEILWSWHIWFTDQPQAQVYKNNAGTMMDRNLGATSATPGDVGALGLLYQWGRKDPFLGSSSISSSTTAKSTISWPSELYSTSSTGTISYATAHPTTFITYNISNEDWYYTGLSSTDNTRWTTSDKSKSIYDPCPSGWRVPDGGSQGVWSKAGFGGTTYDGTDEGVSFSISSPSTTWYPASGYRLSGVGSLTSVGSYGSYWSASPYDGRAWCLGFSGSADVYPSSNGYRAGGRSVRCLQVIDEVAEP